ncbi:hypothetical protein HMPREF9442_00291 [Paraprevotella xylaniphila YIT 11841]|uniref:Uncharacterized protein n=1 Tax=Paraprevotella xylaniphila YIT 11841 TaxID=762982 RepID=F3QQ53_9BACT|nr:hypothetical protein HMPREF9442_00291 [Paraprevotella xylaniphila YIT 11841]
MILPHRDFIILASERGKTGNKDRDCPLTSAITDLSVLPLQQFTDILHPDSCTKKGSNNS